MYITGWRGEGHRSQSGPADDPPHQQSSSQSPEKVTQTNNDREASHEDKGIGTTTKWASNAYSTPAAQQHGKYNSGDSTSAGSAGRTNRSIFNRVFRVAVPMCGVMMRLGADMSGWSRARGSGSVTSTAAPARTSAGNGCELCVDEDTG